jgi:hypothetical protein
MSRLSTKLSYEQLLSGAAGTLDRQARYWPREPDFELGRVPFPTAALTVTNTWVVFARRKGTNFLIEDIRRLRAAVEAGPVPEGAPKTLVEDAVGVVPERQPRTWRGLSSGLSSTDIPRAEAARRQRTSTLESGSRRRLRQSSKRRDV